MIYIVDSLDRSRALTCIVVQLHGRGRFQQRRPVTGAMQVSARAIEGRLTVVPTVTQFTIWVIVELDLSRRSTVFAPPLSKLAYLGQRFLPLRMQISE